MKIDLIVCERFSEFFFNSLNIKIKFSVNDNFYYGK